MTHNPTPGHPPARARQRISRLTATLRTPGYHRRLLIRRAAAVLLVCAAAATALGGRNDTVTVAATDILAGQEITADDITTRTYPRGLAPHPLPAREDIIGAIAAHSVVTGDVINSYTLMGTELTNAFVSTNTNNGQGGEGNMVALKLADPALAPLLAHGDTVSIVTAAENDPEPILIAAGGTIISTHDPSGQHGTSAVLVALPAADARTVAATALHTPLAVVITGPRARGR